MALGSSGTPSESLVCERGLLGDQRIDLGRQPGDSLLAVGRGERSSSNARSSDPVIASRWPALAGRRPVALRRSCSSRSGVYRLRPDSSFSPHRRSGHPATRRRLDEGSDGDSSFAPSCWMEGVPHRREIGESLELVTAALGQLIYRGSVDAHVSPPTQRGHERRSSVRKGLPSFAAHRVEGRTRHRRTNRGDYLDRELGLPVLADESAAHARLVPSAAIACIIMTPPLLPSR
jgi:hypothetical protein